MSSNQNSTSGTQSQEYVVRVPKQSADKKKHHVMRFNSSMNIDCSKWTQGRLERENNQKDMKMEDEMPKFGAGSEFGRQQREEARRRKYGMIAKKYNPDDQPWLLRIGGKNGKKYRGIREGGVTENASYYVFKNASDGAFEAFPIEEWYNFFPIQTYKTLNAEEAEEEFGRRDKVFNYFSIMMKKRLKAEEGMGEGEGEEKPKKGAKKSGEFKISDMDDWVHTSEDDDDEEEGGSDKEKVKKNKKKKPNLKKKKKKDSDEEAEEESDDGDDEGREVDYISDESSNSEDMNETKDKGDMKGVEDEEAIRKMENSESEEENEEEKKDVNTEVKEEVKETKEKRDESSSDTSSDTSDSDDFDDSFHSAMFMPDKKKDGSAKKTTKKGKKETSSNSKGSKVSEKSVQNEGKRPASYSDKLEGFSSKKIKLDPGAGSSNLSSPVPSSSSPICMDGITEDAVRRYLMRKPMTTTELIQKFKSKKTGISRDQMVNTITQILKRLNPDKQMIKGKMHLSIKHS